MEDISLLLGHIKDLSLSRNYKDILTFTSFLTLSEISEITPILESSKDINNYYFYGGNMFSERKILFFLPTYIDKNDLINNPNTFLNEIISVIKIYPKNIKYFENNLSHRDYLGALMNLGLKREFFGDIYIKDKVNAYVFVKKEIENEVINNISKIRHSDVKVQLLDLNNEEIKNIKPNFKELEVNVSSLRLDNVISSVFSKLSREDSKTLINNEFVFVNGITIKSPSFLLKDEDRVSIKSKGKFIFNGVIKTTRKDRYLISISLYK